MKTKLTFKSKDLAPMLKHAMAHDRCLSPYDKTPTQKIGLWLIKDEGIYLMSPTTDKRFRTVVYAQGYNPKKENRDTLWDKTHNVRGGDLDEFLSLCKQQVKNICKGGSVTVWMGEEGYRYAA